jgi:superfamily II DNA or RNA helicase
MEDFREGKINVLIGTLSIFAEGIDIPDLDVIINASGNKGDVKSIQVLGRVLRTFKEKNEALYYDFLDRGVHTRKHSHKRIKILQKQGYEIKINDDFC